MSYRSTRQNYCTNSSFETDLTNVFQWSIGGTSGASFSRVSDWGSVGAYSVRYNGTITGVGGLIGVGFNPLGTVSAAVDQIWFGRAAINVINGTISTGTYAWIAFFDAGNNYIDRFITSPIPNLDTGQQIVEAFGTAPASTASVVFSVVSQSQDTGDVVDVRVDDVALERVAPAGYLNTVLSALPAASTLTLYDEWSGVANGSLPLVANTGQTWVLSHGGVGSTDFLVTSNRATSQTPTGASYAETTLPDFMTRTEAQFRFPSGGDPAGALSFGSWQTPISDRLAAGHSGGPNTNIHLAIDRSSWGLGYWEDDDLLIYATEFFTPALSDNTSYVITMVRERDILVIKLPDGTARTIRSPKVTELAGNWAYFEISSHYGDGPAPGFEYISATSEPIELGLRTETVNYTDGLGIALAFP